MESTLCFGFYPQPRIPLGISSSLHAAKLSFSFCHSSVTPGKISRRSPAGHIFSPITCTVGGFRTSSKHDKGSLGRVSFALACVVGVISCSSGLNYKAIAAPEIGTGSSQTESTAPEGVSTKDSEFATKGLARVTISSDASKMETPQSKASPLGDPHLAAAVVGPMASDSAKNADLQQPNSHVPLSVPQVIGEEEFPQIQLVHQHAFSSVQSSDSGESLLSKNREEEDLKSTAQKEFHNNNNDVQVNSVRSSTDPSPAQSPQLASGVHAVTPLNKGSSAELVASPLVAVILEMDPYTMSNPMFLSSSTVRQGEPRVRDSRSPRIDGSRVLVHGIPVSPSIAHTVEQIFAKHGDITANCVLKDPTFRGHLIEGLVTVMQLLQEHPERELSNGDKMFIYSKLEDLETAKVHVGWLTTQINDLGPLLNMAAFRRQLELMAAEVEEIRTKLAEQESKLAHHEGALTHQDTEVADFETPETKGEKPVHAGWWNEVGILLQAFGIGSLLYLFFGAK